MRRRTRLALVTALLLAGAVAAYATQVVKYESITVADTAIGITPAILDPPGELQIAQCSARLETGQIRYRWDGTAPTSAEGTLVQIGDVVEIESHEDAARIRFIRTGTVSGVLKVHCWR